jgi:hypothetical protein
MWEGATVWGELRNSLCDNSIGQLRGRRPNLVKAIGETETPRLKEKKGENIETFSNAQTLGRENRKLAMWN